MGSGCPGPYVISVGLKVVKKVRVEGARGVVNLIWRQWRLNCALPRLGVLVKLFSCMSEL